ncbi:uncharacterized protein P174DRAFT_436260 [Aspergillus novofumigatus IBT 16806]|uniref:Uncharacterized protein n=1 Tax=Aspergillus novofumigatus (strain IBT 16806) TaxID=1392255 RepID=A0A2I1BSG0_ASPN1|nr:uncharacterized protein P174DRAFT_436260 [Aspergillus novofumigatus IBT 16806]PKX88335.1 hypothetical protein P174DRAFT_436260 [Aspergillus novofumigatus IBT 16806]
MSVIISSGSRAAVQLLVAMGLIIRPASSLPRWQRTLRLSGRINQGAVSTGHVENHLFHGYGRHFYDTGGGDGLYNLTDNEKRLNGTYPIPRDTTVLYAYRRLESVAYMGYRCRPLDDALPYSSAYSDGHADSFCFWQPVGYKEQSALVYGGYLILTYGGSAYGNTVIQPSQWTGEIIGYP